MFDNVKFYTSYLGNASNRIPLESVFMGAIFHNYKQLLQIAKEDDIVIDEDSLIENLESYLKPNLRAKSCFTDSVKSGMVSCNLLIKKID